MQNYLGISTDNVEDYGIGNSLLICAQGEWQKETGLVKEKDQVQDVSFTNLGGFSSGVPAKKIRA